jgi:hypothetical protein
MPMPGRNFGHIPDMVLVREPYESGMSRSIAIELELNRKTLSEWKLIISAYRDCSLFEHVVYFVPDAGVERALTVVVQALGADQKVYVQPFAPVDLTAEPPTANTY